MSSSQVCALGRAGTVRCFTDETLVSFEAGQQHDFGPAIRALAQALVKSGVGKRRPASPTPKTKKKTWVGGWVYPDGRGLSDVVDLVTFNQDSTAVTKTGEVFSWGNAERGTAGFPVDSKGYVGPTRIAGVGRAVCVVGDFQHRCVLDDEGAVWCFGEGAPGARDRKDPEVAARIAGLPKVTALSASKGCTYALGEDATLYALRSSPFDACGVAVPDDPLSGTPDPTTSEPIVVALLPP
jgi:alpha-tubulin suppressor-like RCC1 family protein